MTAGTAAPDPHEAYEELIRMRPEEARRLKRENPGVGLAWAFPDLPGARPILIDPDTGRSVRDGYRRPVLAEPGGAPPLSTPGLTPPPVKRARDASQQTVGVDPEDVARRLRVDARPNQHQRAQGLKIVTSDRRVTVHAPRPVLLNVEEARAAGLLPVDVDLGLDTFFEASEAGPYVRAALAPFFETTADILQAFAKEINDGNANLGPDASEAILALPQAGSRTTNSRRHQRAVARLTPPGRTRYTEVLTILRDTEAPSGAVLVERDGDTFHVTLRDTGGYRVPEPHRGKTWRIIVSRPRPVPVAGETIAWLRGHSRAAEQQIDEHPALLVVHGVATTARDKILALAFPVRGAAMGVAELLRLHVSVREADDAGDVARAVVRALISEGAGRAAGRYMDQLDAAKLGRRAKPVLDTAKTIITKALNDIVDWGIQEGEAGY